MQVILLHDVEALGLRGDVVDVKRGYARNFLLPRRLAETERQVCGIEMRVAGGGTTQCTGFLVGDDLVMTVGAPIVPPLPGGVLCLFEYDKVESHPQDPIVVEADHVRVLRLARPIARTLQSRSASVAVRTRGWISPARRASPRATDTILIVQYVGGTLRVSAGALAPAEE